MSKWGIRTEQGGVEPVDHPKSVEERDVHELKDHKGLQDMKAAVEVATATQLPGAPTSMVSTMSIRDYTPPEDAITAALTGI